MQSLRRVVDGTNKQTPEAEAAQKEADAQDSEDLVSAEQMILILAIQVRRFADVCLAATPVRDTIGGHKGLTEEERPFVCCFCRA